MVTSKATWSSSGALTLRVRLGRILESPLPHTRAEPEVILEFLFDRGVLSISVRNIGARAALKVAVAFDQRFTGLGGSKELSSLPLFRNIEFLGPGREIATLVDTSASYFARKQPTRITAQVSYRDAEQRAYETTIVHDLDIYRDLSWVVTSSPDQKGD